MTKEEQLQALQTVVDEIDYFLSPRTKKPWYKPDSWEEIRPLGKAQSLRNAFAAIKDHIEGGV